MRDVPDWDEYFMNIAEAVAKRSRDPTTQVGAVVVDPSHRILATGYNGMIPGLAHDQEAALWSEDKYSYVAHAERNALDALASIPPGCTMYCTLHPCQECLKALISRKFARLVYRSTRDSLETPQFYRLAALGRIKVERYVAPGGAGM